MRLSQNQRFNTALRTARTLEVDMTEVFAHLARECIRLARNPDPLMYAPCCEPLPLPLTFRQHGEHVRLAPHGQGHVLGGLLGRAGLAIPSGSARTTRWAGDRPGVHEDRL
jgi:hypothetical protein